MSVFSTIGYSPENQVSVWQEIMSDVYYSLEVKSGSSEGLRGSIRQFDVGCLSITNFDSDAQRVFRTRSRISRDPEDAFVFVTPFRGDLYYSQMGRSGFVKPGGYVLISTSEFYELSCYDGFVNWTVKVPGEDLRRRIPDVEDYCACRLANNPAMAGIARSHIYSIAQALDGQEIPNARGVAASLIEVIVLALNAEGGREGAKVSAARVRARILEYIRRNIHDSSLNPTSIARENGVSVSYIYKLFQSSGITVGEYILSQRLQSAYELLALSSERKMTVAEAAYASGFRNLSHFSRVFQERYRVAPSAVRKLPT